jgi:hypothetical protein
MTDRTELERQIAELQAQLAAMDAEPDWEAWRPAVEAYRDAFHWSFHQLEHINPEGDHEKHIVAGLIAALPLAPAEPVDEACAYSPAPKWVQDSIPDWAFERVAQLVGYGDKHGPRGSRAGVAFARYIANHEATLAHRGARWPGEDWLEGEAVDVANETKHPYNAALEMARRLRAYQTGGAA